MHVVITFKSFTYMKAHFLWLVKSVCTDEENLDLLVLCPLHRARVIAGASFFFFDRTIGACDGVEDMPEKDPERSLLL